MRGMRFTAHAIVPAAVAVWLMSLANGFAEGAHYCTYVSRSFTTPVVLVPDPKSIAHLWRGTYNCFGATATNQQVMYFTAAPREHSEAFTGRPLLFDWDEDGALLLVDTHGMHCAVTVEYWSEDGTCPAAAAGK
jgi:hypothetical protein